MHQIRRLLSRHSQPAKVRLAKLNKPSRRERLNLTFQTQEHRLRRTQRHLLFKDDMDQCAESGGSLPQRRIAIRRVDVRKQLVASRKLARGLRESLLRQWPECLAAQVLAGRQEQEVLKQDAAVARFVGMFPACAALVPVFERLLEMKLDRVDQLAVAALDHHLVATEIRSGE